MVRGMAYGCSNSGDCLFGKKKLQGGQQGTAETKTTYGALKQRHYF